MLLCNNIFVFVCFISLCLDFNENGDSDSDTEDADNVVIGVIVGLCVGVLLTVSVIVYKRHHDSGTEPLALACLSHDDARARASSSEYSVFVSNNGRDSSSYVPVEEESVVELAVTEL